MLAVVERMLSMERTAAVRSSMTSAPSDVVARARMAVGLYLRT